MLLVYKPINVLRGIMMKGGGTNSVSQALDTVDIIGLREYHVKQVGQNTHTITPIRHCDMVNITADKITKSDTV